MSEEPGIVLCEECCGDKLDNTNNHRFENECHLSRKQLIFLLKHTKISINRIVSLSQDEGRNIIGNIVKRKGKG